MEQQESVLLTDEQVAAIAEKYSDDTVDTDWAHGARNLLRAGVERDYRAGWKECTEHYRELIEAGVRWKELMEAVEAERKDEWSIEITNTLRENVGWHVFNIIESNQTEI